MKYKILITLVLAVVLVLSLHSVALANDYPQNVPPEIVLGDSSDIPLMTAEEILDYVQNDYAKSHLDYVNKNNGKCPLHTSAPDCTDFINNPSEYKYISVFDISGSRLLHNNRWQNCISYHVYISKSPATVDFTSGSDGLKALYLPNDYNSTVFHLTFLQFKNEKTAVNVLFQEYGGILNYCRPLQMTNYDVYYRGTDKLFNKGGSIPEQEPAKSKLTADMIIKDFKSYAKKGWMVDVLLNGFGNPFKDIDVDDYNYLVCTDIVKDSNSNITFYSGYISTSMFKHSNKHNALIPAYPPGKNLVVKFEYEYKHFKYWIDSERGVYELTPNITFPYDQIIFANHVIKDDDGNDIFARPEDNHLPEATPEQTKDVLLGKDGKLQQQIFDGAKSMIVPREKFWTSHITDIQNILQDKLDYDVYTAAMENIRNVSSGNIPNITVDIKGKTITVVDFQYFKKYREQINSWTRGIIFVLLVVFNINMMYKLIRGGSFSSGSDVKGDKGAKSS